MKDSDDLVGPLDVLLGIAAAPKSEQDKLPVTSFLVNRYFEDLVKLHGMLVNEPAGGQEPSEATTVR